MIQSLFLSNNSPKPQNDFLYTTQYWSNSTYSVHMVVCDFNISHYKPKLFSELNIFLPSKIKAAVEKRQAEFLAGRFAAQKAILFSSPDYDRLPDVSIGKNRAPVWPKGLIGSITHTSSRAICVVAREKQYEYIGIDSEEVMLEKCALELAAQIHDDSEINQLLRSGISPNIATTIIFSAKESLFKALYPKVKEYFNFDCATVCHFNLTTSTLYLELDKEFSQLFNLKRNYKVEFFYTIRNVTTLIKG